MKNMSFLSENFQFLEVNFSIYLNRHVFVTSDIFLISTKSYIVGYSLELSPPDASSDTFNVIPALVAQLDAPSDWRPGGHRFNPGRGQQHSFMEIDHEYFLRSFSPFR